MPLLATLTDVDVVHAELFASQVLGWKCRTRSVVAVAEAPASYDVCRGQDAHHFRIAVPDVLALPGETADGRIWLPGSPICNRGAIWDT